VSENPIDSSSIVLVGTAPNEIVADLWRQVLLDEGVIAMIKPIGLGFAYVSNSLNPHHIYVRTDQADLARDVIASLSEEKDDDASSGS
jgi:hypothetical protein